MKTTLVCALAVTVGLGLAATPLLAHHSFAAEFDGAKAVDLMGTVVNWGLETGPPNVLYRGGWRRDTVKPGDAISVHGFVAKDGSHTLAARQITTPDGRRLFAGSPDNGPKQ
jgi:Family of unknown function (DUF6152)